MSPPKVIVFGANGAVGSSAALTASRLGAHVVLALLDPSAPIPGLSATSEATGRFQRVYADLTLPSTIHSAVSSTGATRAFLYLAHSSPDHMLGTITALKTSGVEQVVFLSSFAAQGDLAHIPAEEIIPFVHAQVELNLAATYGPEGYVALCPGSFASNMVQWKDGVHGGMVRMYASELPLDMIAPSDVGRVAGSVLVRGLPEHGKRRIGLFGPEMVTQRRAVEIVAGVLGVGVQVEAWSGEEEVRHLVEKRGAPERVAVYLVGTQRMGIRGVGDMLGSRLDEGERGNVEIYSGRKALGFEEWVRENRGLFEKA